MRSVDSEVLFISADVCVSHQTFVHVVERGPHAGDGGSWIGRGPDGEAEHTAEFAPDVKSLFRLLVKAVIRFHTNRSIGFGAPGESEALSECSQVGNRLC